MLGMVRFLARALKNQTNIDECYKTFLIVNYAFYNNSLL
jgi:hypothetical protein